MFKTCFIIYCLTKKIKITLYQYWRYSPYYHPPILFKCETRCHFKSSNLSEKMLKKSWLAFWCWVAAITFGHKLRILKAATSFRIMVDPIWEFLKVCINYIYDTYSMSCMRERNVIFAKHFPLLLTPRTVGNSVYN